MYADDGEVSSSYKDVFQWTHIFFITYKGLPIDKLKKVHKCVSNALFEWFVFLIYKYIQYICMCIYTYAYTYSV